MQTALIAREFSHVIVFTRPPVAVQRVVFAVLAPVAKALGYRAIEERYCRPHGRVSPDAEAMRVAGLG